MHAADMPEAWRDVPGYEGRYQVSDQGRVRSLPRPVRCTSCRGEEVRIAAGIVLKPVRDSSGHLTVQLGRKNRRMVHRLVHEAFIGPIPNGLDVAHLNGTPDDNRPINLQAVTRAENNQHVVFHGRRPLSVDQVQLIRRRIKPGASTADRQALADELGIRRRHLNAVARGGSYAYVR